LGYFTCRKMYPLGPFRRPMPRVLGGAYGGGRVFMGEVPLYTYWTSTGEGRSQPNSHSPDVLLRAVVGKLKGLHCQLSGRGANLKCSFFSSCYLLPSQEFSETNVHEPSILIGRAYRLGRGANAYTYWTSTGKGANACTYWTCKCIHVLDFLGGVQMHTRIRLSGRGANAYTY